jgi:hypothetical protein
MKDTTELDSLMNKEEYEKFAKESSSWCYIIHKKIF